MTKEIIIAIILFVLSLSTCIFFSILNKKLDKILDSKYTVTTSSEPRGGYWSDKTVIELDSKVDDARDRMSLLREQIEFYNTELDTIKVANQFVFNEINSARVELGRPIISRENEIDISEYDSIPSLQPTIENSWIFDLISSPSTPYSMIEKKENGMYIPSTFGSIEDVPPAVRRKRDSLEVFLYSIKQQITRLAIIEHNLKIRNGRILLRIANQRLRNCRLNLRLNKLHLRLGKDVSQINLGECSPVSGLQY
jgi:hypothetical protein